MPRFTSVQERWPFISLSANLRRVRTESEKVPTCGSGSGSDATIFSMLGMSERKPRNSFPFGPLM